MIDQSNHKISSPDFLKTDRGKTKTNAIEVPSITLPKGGGAIKGIDEKFSVNAVNGTASFSIPLPVSPARGVSPALSLSYNSGAGNGVFGLGWNVGLASIKRKSDKGLPQYFDVIDSDIFLFSGAEDLVPEFKKEPGGDFLVDANGDYVINEIDSQDALHVIRFYRPRIEGLFARIERWTNKISGLIKWRVITRDNVTTLFGWSGESVIADSKDQGKIYEWLPEFVFDDKGNCCHYVYKAEDDKGLDGLLLHNKNRLQNNSITYTNRYVEKVLYGNKTPYKKFGDSFPSDSSYMFNTVFDYGEYDNDTPYEKVKDWDFRTDAFSDYKAGFEIRTTRLCKRVLLFHYFDELLGGFALVKSIDFEYDTSAEEDFTFLKSITAVGYIKGTTGTYTTKKLPPAVFEYQKHEWSAEIKDIDAADLVHAPSGLGESHYQFTDLFNEGLSGILTEQATGWYYKHNLGNGRFSHATLVTPKPSFVGLGNQLQLIDLDADGGKQLVNFAAEPKGYFELDHVSEWQPFRYFQNLPNVELSDANTRLLDLNGDGKPEILISEDNFFSWYESEGRSGFSASQKTIKEVDEEAGPHVVFADQDETIFLADMSGDGMTDIVRIRNSEVCYWPNLGYGKFGAKVAMDNSPLFDSPDQFNAAFLRLADIDGSGTTDIIYLGKNNFTCWLNLSGNRFATVPFKIDIFPEIHNQASVTIADILGNGVSCIVWSSGLTKDATAPLKYIDLMRSKKPHVLVSYKNNLGKEVTIEYKPSTHFYLEDKAAGKPWVTKLHFPIHCIAKTETRDKISGYRFVSAYKYHHGYYDHAEREFRGFGMVEQIDAERFEHWVAEDATNIVARELHQEPVVSKTWIHTGAFINKGEILTQFAHEYWYAEMERHGFAVLHYEVPLQDARLMCAPGLNPSLIDQLSVQEWREAMRACKGITLRSEVFAEDALKHGNTDEALRKELTPFAVSTHNCMIQLLQPKGRNKHAVFTLIESEAITYSYERAPEDPRIAHNLTIKVDDLANVLESATVVYPRIVPNTSLPEATQLEQNKTIIIYSQNQFTNDIVGDHNYRLRLPSEVKSYELKGVGKSNPFYAVTDFENSLLAADEVAYHQLDNNPAAGNIQKRLIEHVRSVYYNNLLTDALPLHHLESLAIPYESFQLAYTPELITDIFGNRVNASLLAEGKFSEENGNWWIRSGTTQFIRSAETVSHAQDRFYVPISYTDPYGSKTKIKYYGNYFLFIEETEDELGNKSRVDLFNFRTLLPQRIRDINDNFSESITDELGMVKAVAVFGKGDEADDLIGHTEHTTDTEQNAVDTFFNTLLSTDLIAQGKTLLQRASVRYVYDFNAYQNAGKPAVVSAITREEHFRKNSNSPVQISFEYCNGLGQVVMKKVQAEPGVAKKVIVNTDNTYTVAGVDTSAISPKQLRWIGSGRTILNNKGNPVKQYEPYFSATHQYEDIKELVEAGVTPLLYYDAVGRLVRAEMPDGTFTKVEFTSWQQFTHDANDTVLESAWYRTRTDPSLVVELLAAGKDPIKEKAVALKAAKHANTPSALHLDTLGRPVLSVEHNKNIATSDNEFYQTKTYLDTEGNLRSVIDARNLPENDNKGNTVMEYKYDMLGNLVYQKSMDAGQRWMFLTILGTPLRIWDERSHELQYFYDVLHRPTYSKVIGGEDALDNVYERIFYGETEPDAEVKNLRGRVVRHYDTAGLVDIPGYDFKGEPLSATRRLFKNYKTTANWVDGNLLSDLETAAFTFITTSDALGRLTKQISPDGSILTASYNEGGLLQSETVTHNNPQVETTYIKDIDYNEKGQRSKIIFGNDIVTRFYYDKETFRLTNVVSKRHNSELLQYLIYTYDAVGNICSIEDKAIPIGFFANSQVEPISDYTYDALYRLVEATGRENNTALNFGACDNWNDKPFLQHLSQGDPMLVRTYTQRYQYDAVGNILEMKHIATGGNWTRNYAYEASTNRLRNTVVGNNNTTANYTTYAHHPQHGFLTELPHLERIRWNFKEEVVQTTRQHCTDDNIPVITYYQYDGNGQRIRKITENQATAGTTPTKKEERIYIGGYETYRTFKNNTINFERESLSLIDEGNRFVMIDTVKQNLNPSPHAADIPGVRLVRYQLHNHLGSSTLELDGAAGIISYEEYHPFGTTAYQANNAAIKATAKRYKYTGMERDEETGLEYHSARYYLPWLGRWLSSDPIGIRGGINLYCYSGNRVVIANDRSGHFWWVVVPLALGYLLDDDQADKPKPAPDPPKPKKSSNNPVCEVEDRNKLDLTNLLQVKPNVSRQTSMSSAGQSSFKEKLPTEKFKIERSPFSEEQIIADMTSIKSVTMLNAPFAVAISASGRDPLPYIRATEPLMQATMAIGSAHANAASRPVLSSSRPSVTTPLSYLKGESSPQIVSLGPNGLPNQLGGTPVGPAFKTFEDVKGKGNHITEIVVTYRGKSVATWWEASEKGSGFAGHTEQKALTRINLRPGVTVEIRGEHPPCPYGSGCANTMRGMAELSGARIIYRRLNGAVTEFRAGDESVASPNGSFWD